MAEGWKQAPSCAHLWILGAALTIGFHPAGHEWVCVCGKVFVVTLNDEGRKQLVPRG